MQKAALLCCSAHVNMSGMFRVSFTQLVSGSQTSHAASQGSFISARPSLCLTNCESSLPLFLFLTSFFSPCTLSTNMLFLFIFPRALPGMMQWIRSQRPGESGINIITADFVELGEFISAVITLNYHLDDEDDDAT